MGDELALNQPADNAARSQRVIFGDGAFAFRGGEHRRAEALGQRGELRRCAIPEDAEPDQDDGLARLGQHVERHFQAGPIGLRLEEVRHKGAAVGLPGVARRLALRQVELDRTRWPAGRLAHSPPHLLAHGFGVDGRAPLHQRSIEGDLIDFLTQARGVGRCRILVGDGDQRRAIERSIGDAIDHVGCARPARRQAHARRAGDLTPGRSEHCAGDFLLHEEERHVALARGVDQLDELAAWMTDDEGRSGFLERIRKHLDRRRHGSSALSAVVAGIGRCDDRARCAAGHQDGVAVR